VPDLHDLDHFDEGLPAMNLLAAPEIRRRGDRMRRRRTAVAAVGGVLAAALAIGTPVIALSGSGANDRGNDAIAPSPSRTDDATMWRTEIPDNFPLTAGFADENAVPNDGLAGDPSLTGVCGSEGFAGFVDNAVVTYQGESEDREVRLLVVYPDDAAAAAELDELRNDISSCGPVELAKKATMVYGTVPIDLGTEESYAFTQQVRHPDGLLSDLSLFELARTGNAIYVDMSYGAAGGDQVIGIEAERLKDNSAAPLAALCTFAAVPC
jgi:hypothetical protein